MSNFDTNLTWAFGAAMAFITSPIGLIVIAIGLLIAAGVALYQNWDVVSAKAMEIWGGIRDFFVGLGEKIGEVVGKMKDRFVDAFGKMKDGVRAPINAILGMGNGLISGFEKIINGIANAVNKIPSMDIPGIGKIGVPDIPTVSLPRIPELAQGGITTGATLAMIGEGAEQEAVLPLSKLDQFINRDDKGGGDTTNNDSDQVVFHYNAEVHVHGGADANEVREAMEMSQRDFERKMRKWLQNQRRVNLGN